METDWQRLPFQFQNCRLEESNITFEITLNWRVKSIRNYNFIEKDNFCSFFWNNYFIGSVCIVYCVMKWGRGLPFRFRETHPMNKYFMFEQAC